MKHSTSQTPNERHATSLSPCFRQPSSGAITHIPPKTKYFNNLSLIATLAITFLCSFTLNAQSPPQGQVYAVELSAQAQEDPAQITLIWTSLTNKGGYTIYKRTTGINTSWGTPIATLESTATEYTDTDVEVGIEYEYHITRGTTGDGYIRSGIKVPVKDNHGKVLFIVERSIASTLATELKLMEKMMVADGWQVVRAEVSKDDTVPAVKAVIQDLYNADPTNTKALYLFGHVPVPYSGKLKPDGHWNHEGAWPADVFYADIDGTWTDTSITSTVADHSGDPTRNHNIPGDGKYDQKIAPSHVELEMGRVDLVNLPKMSALGGEIDLLRNYINKNYNYRYKQLALPRRALVYDGFEWKSTTPSADIYRESAAFFGQGQVTDLASGEYMPTLAENGYLWAHGEGGGYFHGAKGVSNTSEVAETDPKCVFYTTFGSWFGDWDSKDNFLKSFIATETYGLANIWAGFNHMFFQDMALGYNIGRAVKILHNNVNITDVGYTLQNKDWNFPLTSSYGRVHMQLMGDPTLRMFTVHPVSNLTASSSGLITWDASIDTNIVGYHIYKANNELGPYTRITTEVVDDTSYTDSIASPGAWYMVRAIKLEVTGSGSFYNPSQGIMAQADGTPTPDTTAPAAITILQSTETTTSSITINWIATGDDGNIGTATSYDIRVSLEEITGDNFDSAVQLPTAPTPTAAGTTQSTTLDELVEDTTYYFAIKAIDEVGNTSTISNIVSATTTKTITGTSDWLVLDSSMLSYEVGSTSISLDPLVDEQNALNIDPEDGTATPDVSSYWKPTYGDAPTFVLDLGLVYNLQAIAIQDYWGSANLTITYWNETEWTELCSWDMTYANQWRVIEVNTETDKLKFEFAALGAKIKEIGIKAVLDSTAPAAITDLTPSDATTNSATLNWTATGDDEFDGTAETYDIRMSSEPITEENFETATQLSGLPTPGEAGTAELMLIDNLEAATTYYFAVKAYDEAGNESGLSNIASTTTSSGATANWLTLDSSMLSYETGNEKISLATLVDEQAVFATEPVDGESNPTTTSSWQPTYGDTPIFIVDLKQDCNLNKVAIKDYWGSADLTVSYWNGTEWVTLFNWGLTYANSWRVIETNVTTSKLKFEFSKLGGKISEIGIKGVTD